MQIDPKLWGKGAFVSGQWMGYPFLYSGTLITGDGEYVIWSDPITEFDPVFFARICQRNEGNSTQRPTGTFHGLSSGPDEPGGQSVGNVYPFKIG